MSALDEGERLRIVVLGASGFLGSSMTRHLANQGHDVIAYWRQPRPDIAKLPNVTSMIGDLRDAWVLGKAFHDTDIVYHFASSTYPSRFYFDPGSEYSEALQPLLVMMETARQHQVRKIVFPSSGGTVYADIATPRTEDSPVDPRSPYAVFKLAAEQLLHHAARQGHFSVDVFRLGNPFGLGQRARPGQGVVPHWMDALNRREPIVIFGDGSAERDYVYIDDVCRMMTMSCSDIDQSGTYNVGTGVPTSLRQLASIIQELTRDELRIEYVPNRISDIASIALSPDRILSRMPGFEFTPLSQGLCNTLEHHRLLCGHDSH